MKFVGYIRKEICGCKIVSLTEYYGFFNNAIIQHTKSCKYFAKCGCSGFISVHHNNKHTIGHEEKCRVIKRRNKRTLYRRRVAKKRLDNMIYKERAIAYWVDVRTKFYNGKTCDYLVGSTDSDNTHHLYLFMTVAGRHTRTINLTERLPYDARKKIVDFLDKTRIHDYSTAMKFLEVRYAILFIPPCTISYHYNRNSDFEQKVLCHRDGTLRFQLPNQYCLLNQTNFCEFNSIHSMIRLINTQCAINSNNINEKFGVFNHARYYPKADFSFNIDLPEVLIGLIVEYCVTGMYYDNNEFGEIDLTDDEVIELTGDDSCKKNIILNC